MKKKSLASLLALALLGITALSGCAAGPEAGLTADEAKAKVLEKVPYATVDNIQEFEADFDDGRKEYEGKLVYGKMECEFAIDAKTGEFRDWDVDNFSDCIRCN